MDLMATLPTVTGPATPVPADATREALDRLADALPSLVARDDDPPPLWRSAEFAQQVEDLRTALGPARSADELLRRVRCVGPLEPVARHESFDALARRLARDPLCVALAIRWIELASDRPLAAWPALVRRRSLALCPADPELEVATWFG